MSVNNLIELLYFESVSAYMVYLFESELPENKLVFLSLMVRVVGVRLKRVLFGLCLIGNGRDPRSIGIGSTSKKVSILFSIISVPL